MVKGRLAHKFPFVSCSTVSVPKSGKGRPSMARRSTVDDKNALITCIENGDFTKAAKIAAGETLVLSTNTLSGDKGQDGTYIMNDTCIHFCGSGLSFLSGIANSHLPLPCHQKCIHIRLF